MNRKQFVTLIVLGLVVGGLGLYLYNKQKESYTASSFASDARVIKDFPLNTVAQVRILEQTNEVHLVRGEQGWTVQERHNYPANFSEISEFLRKTWELKPVQEVEVGASQYGRLELVNPAESKGENSGTLVEFKDDKGAVLKSMVLGKSQTRESPPSQFGGGGEYPVGRYILVPENPPKVWLVSETFTSVEPQPQQWINKDWFKVEKIKSVAVTSPNPAHTWTITRESEGGDWQMASLSGDESFDKAKASSLNYLLSSPSFNDVAGLDAEIAATNQLVQAKILTFDGFTYDVRVAGQTNDESLLLSVDVSGDFTKERSAPADEKPEEKEQRDQEFKEKLDKLQEKLKNEQKFNPWTYQVSKWTVDALLKPRTDFFATPSEPQESESPSLELPSGVPPFPALPPELKDIIPPEPAE